MLCEKYTSENDIKVKTGLQLFPKISDRDFWENAKESSIEFFEKNVKQYEGVEREHLTATLYRQFFLNGDRVAFEKVYFARRSELVNKVILECFYNDGRYIDDIVDLTWMILEETTWTVPAHIKFAKGCDSLPVAGQVFIDLFSAETACTMAFVYQVMRERLDGISVNISPRIVTRITEHLDEYLENSSYWWMGFTEGARPNNWNPWVNSNILLAAFTTLDDIEKLRKLVYKVMRSLDVYYDQYPLDGACDEGSVYWGQAGLSMLEDLWLLNIGTDGQIDFWEEEKVKNTLEFFMKVYTENGQAVNFADAGINVPCYYPSIYKFAKLMKNEKVMSFAKHLFDTVNVNDAVAGDATARMARLSGAMTKTVRMMDIITYSPELEKMGDTEFIADSDYYLASTQVLTSRKKADAREGIFLAAKGGHNGEHHNHNDVGSFILYKNGTKFLIDSGNMQYRKETFGALRYTLWTTRSVYHNLPLIDGIEQNAGEQFAAKDAKYEQVGDKSLFSLDIAGAYPTDIIEKWVRTLEYDKAAQTVTVTEDFAFTKECDYSIHFLTPQKAEMTGKVLKLTAENGEMLEMEFSAAMDFEQEKIEYDDHILLRNWGENLYLIKLKARAEKDTIAYVIK